MYMSINVYVSILDQGQCTYLCKRTCNKYLISCVNIFMKPLKELEFSTI